MNVVFLSPHFPLYFHNFCSRLKERNVNVLGIIDTAYDNIFQETKDSLTECYCVSSLSNYEEVHRAVAYFISKYGRIDFIESQNEYWLETEAKLRDDFNIHTGTGFKELAWMKYKSKMKKVFLDAGVNVARYRLLYTFDDAIEFIDEVGYPVVVKPDNGVGASSTYKLNSYQDLEEFYAIKEDKIYIMEEFVKGHVETFDGISDSQKNVIISNSTIMLNSIMDNVNEHCDTAFKNRYVINSDIEEIGKRVVKAFDTRSRFFHFEFFRLDEDQEGLGKKGDIIGLEVNMRAPGAYMPDMINFSYDTDVYTLWADMLIYDKSFMDLHQKYLVGYIGRRTNFEYMYDDNQLRMMFGSEIVLDVDVPEVLSPAMGDHVFMVRSNDEGRLDYLINQFLLKKDGNNRLY